ncbi:MAG TPA: hypothetical protein PLD47_10205 [Aggregatilineales bacterium]|nr:hypothetical protein [Anaerolineales bacterium]HRE48086.1 hypothetical protein [Aggregatilineales bacterium]
MTANGTPPSDRSDASAASPGCLLGILTFLWQGILRLLGFAGKTARATIIPADTQYQAYVDAWVSERIAIWLHETRGEIETKAAAEYLLGKGAHPEIMPLIQQTLIDAKITFSQREGKQFLEVEAYMSPRQMNGKVPQLLRWRAEREIAWQDIPDTVRERLIRLREPVTLAYSLPGAAI